MLKFQQNPYSRIVTLLTFRSLQGVSSVPGKGTSHQWKAVSAGVQPFLEFTANRIGIEATIPAAKNPATLAAVIHRGSDQCNDLFSVHGLLAACMLDVESIPGRGHGSSHGFCSDIACSLARGDGMLQPRSAS